MSAEILRTLSGLRIEGKKHRRVPPLTGLGAESLNWVLRHNHGGAGVVLLIDPRWI